MVYIHVKRAGGKKYYTLRVSVRGKNGKILTKDLENLGTNINKISMEYLLKKYKDKIRKSHETLNKFLESNRYEEEARKKKLKKDKYFSKKQQEEIEGIKIHFSKKFKKMDKLTQQDLYNHFLIKFAVSSTAIEGNTITEIEAEKLLNEELLPKKKTLREVYDLQNHKKVFFGLLEKRQELSHTMIQWLHDDLLRNIDKRIGYRNHDIKIFGQPFKPSPAIHVRHDMDILLKWYKDNRKKIHPLALAIFFHHKFEHIHPFSDGNGRTGRMLMNHILVLENYPPFLIPRKWREEYLNLLNTADRALKKSLIDVTMRDYQGLFEFLVDEYKNTYWNTFLV